MVVSLLAAWALGAARAAPGVILGTPRLVPGPAWRLDLEQHFDRGVPVSDLGAAASLGRRLAVGWEGLFLARTFDAGGRGAREDFAQHQIAAAAVLWERAREPAGRILLAAGGSDSRDAYRLGSAPASAAGERLAAAAVAFERRAGPAEVTLALTGIRSYFKGSRVTRDLAAAGAGAAVEAAGAAWFLEAAPWLVNPLRLDPAWSAGVRLAPRGVVSLALFATNTYGATLGDAVHGLPRALYGFRLSLAPPAGAGSG